MLSNPSNQNKYQGHESYSEKRYYPGLCEYRHEVWIDSDPPIRLSRYPQSNHRRRRNYSKRRKHHGHQLKQTVYNDYRQYVQNNYYTQNNQYSYHEQNTYHGQTYHRKPKSYRRTEAPRRSKSLYFPKETGHPAAELSKSWISAAGCLSDKIYNVCCRLLSI